MVAHTNEFHAGGSVYNSSPRTDGHPVPARPIRHPATIMGRCPSPPLAADPCPAPGILPEPAADAEGCPAGRHNGWRPGITVFGNVLPTAVIREIFDTDDLLARVSRRAGLSAVKSIVPLGYPAIKCVRRREADDLISGRVSAVNPNFTVLYGDLSTAGGDYNPSAPN